MLPDLWSLEGGDVACHYEEQRIGGYFAIDVDNQLFAQVFDLKDPFTGASGIEFSTDLL